MKENHNLETSVLVANAYDEYYIYRSAAGNYFIKYTKEFYTKHSALIPEFNEMKESTASSDYNSYHISGLTYNRKYFNLLPSSK